MTLVISKEEGRSGMKRMLRYFQEQKRRKEYTRLRLEAIEAKKNGDRIRYMVLSARADNMLDKVIFF